MNTVQNGKGDRSRNNWGSKWYAGYAGVNWHHSKASASGKAIIEVPKAGESKSLSRNATGCESLQR
jgi:hypothetical protein